MPRHAQTRQRLPYKSGPGRATPNLPLPHRCHKLRQPIEWCQHKRMPLLMTRNTQRFQAKEKSRVLSRLAIPRLGKPNHAQPSRNLPQPTQPNRVWTTPRQRLIALIISYKHFFCNIPSSIEYIYNEPIMRFCRTHSKAYFMPMTIAEVFATDIKSAWLNCKSLGVHSIDDSYPDIREVSLYILRTRCKLRVADNPNIMWPANELLPNILHIWQRVGHYTDSALLFIELRQFHPPRMGTAEKFYFATLKYKPMPVVLPAHATTSYAVSRYGVPCRSTPESYSAWQRLCRTWHAARVRYRIDRQPIYRLRRRLAKAFYRLHVGGFLTVPLMCSYANYSTDLRD